MAQPTNHYEAAFHDYVCARGWPCVPVDEKRKATFAGARIKSFDFIVYPEGQPAWLCDVKGRKFPYEGKNGRRYWENWVTRDDLDGLRHWRTVFGDGFESVIVFAYWLLAEPARRPAAAIHSFCDRSYAFLCVSVNDYEARSRRRSPRWDTVTVPARDFRELAAPIDGPPVPTGP